MKNLNLTIEQNTTVAFVGESGSGKTTLVNILAGLLKPSKGEVNLNNSVLSKFDLERYRQRIGYITQEAAIFTDDIYNNVTLWAPRTEENVRRFWQTIRDASLEPFVNELEEKESALIGNNGINLSGGQKQRISIARELFKEVDILILDEATSALDSATEKDIKESIESLKGNYTIAIVAHRLSTIKNADSVVLLRDGEIFAQGTYQNLVEQNDLFRQMSSLQQL